MKFNVRSVIVSSLLLFFGSWSSGNADELVSPGGEVVATVGVNAAGNLSYSVRFNETFVVEPSRLGITVDGVDLGTGVELGTPSKTTVDQTYETRGNDSDANNHFHHWKFPVQHKSSDRKYSLQFRLYDDGVAYRYLVPGSGGTQHVDGESSSWKIMPGAKTWYFERLNKDWKLKSYAGEWLSTEIENIHSASPKKIGPVQGTPLVFELPGDLGYAAITKAATYNYSGMRLNPTGGRMLRADFTEGTTGFDVEGTIKTPWRVTMLASDLNQLVNSDLIKNLNPAPDPELFADTNYIKPGRSVWSWESLGLGTPEDQKDYIRYAAQLGFEYTTVDDGWKDWPNPWDTMNKLCDYGRNKKVSVFL